MSRFSDIDDIEFSELYCTNDSDNVFALFSLLSDVENSTPEGEQFKRIGINSLSDILDIPLTQLFLNAIMEHYRTCRLNHAACRQLVKLLNEKGIEVVFDDSIEPDISFVPKDFSDQSALDKEIAATFHQLLSELCRIPSPKEIAWELHLPIDSLCNNSTVTQLSLEHQLVLNYSEWYFSTHTFDFHRHCANLTSFGGCEAEKIDWGKYPFNLFLDVVPAAKQICDTLQKQLDFLGRLMLRLDSIVYFDLSPAERNVVASLYTERPTHFSEPALQWGERFWSCQQKFNTLSTLRSNFRGGICLAKKELLSFDTVSIEELGLSIGARRCLERAGINTVSDLISKSGTEVKRVRNLGQMRFGEISRKVHHLGLHFIDESTWRKNHP